MNSLDVFGAGSAALGIPPVAGALLVVLLLWSLVWKGLALWRAATRREKVWFIVFLIVNTAGILEIIYLFAVTGGKLSNFRISSEK
jgi:hypothetical protein